MTAVSGLTSNGTNSAFTTIAGRYIKVDYTSKQNGTTGNFYAQIAEADPVYSVAVTNKPEVLTIASSLQSSLTFKAKETGYEVVEATKGLFSLRIASILRNRPDVISKIKSSGLVVELTSKSSIANGTKTATYGGGTKSVTYGAVTFSPVPVPPASLANDYTLTFDGIQDVTTVVGTYNAVPANILKQISFTGPGATVLAAGNYSINNVSFSPVSPSTSTLTDDYSLVFDGIQDTDTVINAFNLANPTKTISHDGNGTEILAAGTLSLNKNADGIASFTLGTNKTYKIQLSADSFFAGAYDNEDGEAVDLHELVHILDYLDDTADGSPVLINSAERLALGTARSNLSANLSLPTPTPPPGAGLLYSNSINNAIKITNAESQGYSNSREFLAYASTVFFERGDELAALGADGLSLYTKLSNYFGLATNVADPDTNIFTNVPPIL